MFIGYTKESKGFKLLNIRTKQIFIEISVLFEEPLQYVELAKDKYAEIPSYSAHYLDDEIGSEGYYFSDMMSDICQKKISSSELDSKLQTHLPTWAKKTISSVGENIGNPIDPRRT